MDIRSTPPPDPAPTPTTGTLLGVWAHPDDEAFLSAALMAGARSAGERVVVATATRGERGTDDPRTWPPQRLGPLRERELAGSLAAVGVEEHHWLGHRDGELSQVDPATAVGALAALIDDVRPDTLVTFGPDGMTGHADHRAVSDWVLQAWQRTGSRARLWHATLTPAFHDRWGRLNDEVGLWLPGSSPPATPVAHLAGRVMCDGRLGERKHAALRAHASQTDRLVELVGEQRFRRWWAEEAFVEVADAALVGRDPVVTAAVQGPTTTTPGSLSPGKDGGRSREGGPRTFLAISNSRRRKRPARQMEDS